MIFHVTLKESMRTVSAQTDPGELLIRQSAAKSNKSTDEVIN